VRLALSGNQAERVLIPQFQFDGHNQTLSALEGLPLFTPAHLDVEGQGAAAASVAADDAPAAPAAVGLSTCHIWPIEANKLKFVGRYEIVRPSLYMVQVFKPLPPPPQIHLRQPAVEVALGGGFLRLRGGELAGDTMRASGDRPTRGRVKGFSRGSRRRLMVKLASVDRRKEMYRQKLITLTYPAVWPEDPVTWKRHQHAFRKRFLRRFPTAALVWRMEPQGRGAPHWHILVFNVRFIDSGWIGEVWADITGGRADACSEVRQVRSYRGVMSYAAKYMGKVDQAQHFRAQPGGEPLLEVGRLWGVVNKAYLPAEVRTWALSVAEFYNLRRLLYRYLRSQMRSRGRRRRPGPRDAGSGVSVFASWLSGLQLAAFAGAEIDVARLTIESIRIQEDTDFMRQLLAEARRERAGPTEKASASPSRRYTKRGQS